jgi:TPR repeat protein
MYSFGLFYESGLGVPKDYILAKQWFEKAAAGGNASARRRLTTFPK